MSSASESSSSDSSGKPDPCFDSCNEAFTLGQSVGRTDELCDPNGAFLESYKKCQDCVASDPSNESPGINVSEFFDQLISYCESGDPAELSSALSVASAHGYTLVPVTSTPSTATATTTTSEPNITGDAVNTGPFPTSTFTNDTSDSPTSTPDRSWIAGAVVAPIGALILVAIGIFLFLRRRRKQKAAANDTGDPIGFKAQLHGDSLDPKKELCSNEVPRHHEVDAASKGNEPQYELPANEPPAPEMMDNSRT